MSRRHREGHLGVESGQELVNEHMLLAQILFQCIHKLTCLQTPTLPQQRPCCQALHIPPGLQNIFSLGELILDSSIQPVLHDTGIRKTLGATVTSETFIILQCSACQGVPRPRSVDCHPSVRLSCKKQCPTRVSNGRVGKFLPCPCNTAFNHRNSLVCNHISESPASAEWQSPGPGCHWASWQQCPCGAPCVPQRPLPAAPCMACPPSQLSYLEKV